MDSIGQEIRHAARRLVRAPAFTLASLLTLALAIGAVVSIFAIVQRVVLSPLPYPDSNQLIQLNHREPRLNAPSFEPMPPGVYFQYVDRARTLDRVAAYRLDELTLTGDGEPERIRVTRATPSLAPVMRVSPALGRWFTDAEGAPGAPRVAVLSYGLWMRRYGGDPAVLGRSLALSGQPAEVVGVMPASFVFPDSRVDLWVADQITRATGFGVFTHIGVARLRNGATIEDARTELNSLIADLPQAYPGSSLAVSLGQEPMMSMAITLKEATIGSIERALWILLAAVGLVLLVACANVANLFLVRSDARQRDVAVRRALGAGPAGIARYFLAESVLLSLAGGACGLAIAWGAVRVLVAVGPANLPRLEEVRVDEVALALTFALSMMTALAFGAMPLVSTLRGAALAASLHEHGRGNTSTRGRHRARHMLMAGQIALALVLLVSSGLMVRSVQKLRARDHGFDATSALTFRVGLPDRTYADRASAVAAHHAILDRLSVLPGVKVVSATSSLPLSDRWFGNTMIVQGRVEREDAVRPIVSFRAVAGGYVEAMGMRLLRGRTIDRGDVERRELNVIVNQALVDAFFPNQDPIGERIASNKPPLRPGDRSNLEWLTIVGVVSSTPTRTLAEAKRLPTVYMPMSIAGGPEFPAMALVGPNVAVMSYVVRTATPPLALVPAVRRAVDAVDANLALAEVRTLQDTLDRAAAQMAFTMALLAVAAGVTLMLGVIGIYGVMSYIVSQRTGEIGVRLALGAEPRSVAGMIVRQGGMSTLAGITVGLATALAGSRLIESLLYDVGPRDPSVFGAATLVLSGVALIACWLPARRAARLNPLEALRTD